MIELKNVTLAAVSGVNYGDTLYSLWVSQREIQFGSVKLISGAEIKVPAELCVVEKAIGTQLDSIDEYNRYVIYDLWKHINTDYVLLIQADGYVVNPSMWNNSFLDFDYIGAPWPVRQDSYIDPFGGHQRVGNGGFSLRSSKLLRVPTVRDVVFQVNDDDFYNHQNMGLLSEDGNICVHNRHVFEEEGCIFAPFNLALSFSVETRLLERRMRDTFGFHKKLPVRHAIKDRKLRNLFKSQHARLLSELSL
jgi:hypothetical protein